MQHSRTAFALTTVLLLAAGTGSAEAQKVGTCTSPLGESYLDIGNVRARLFNNGNLFWRGSPSVYEAPKGGGAGAIFNAGIWVGGLVGGELRVAAARYRLYQFWSGPLDDDGNPPADCSVYDRLYKISRSDIDDYEATGAAVPDLREWPTGLGAPTYAAPGNGLDDDADGEVDEEGGEVIALLDQPLDARGDRVIDLAAGERPAILGDQSIWWVMNDRGNEHLPYGTPPIGLEVHAMAFAFKVPGPIGDATFYKYDLFYSGKDSLTDAYVGLYSNVDLGNFQDDWVGSDTVRGLGFGWNSDNEDEGSFGYGTPPPAVGGDFFQGPTVPSTGDTAHVSGTLVPDFRNLKMASFVYFNNSGAGNGEPHNGKEYYNLMRGRWKDGSPILEIGPDERCFWCPTVASMYAGDVGESDGECQFWSECNRDIRGRNNAGGDRQFVMSTGPFTLGPEDPQQIILGIVFARGENNFNSVTKMKQADDFAQAFVDANFFVPAPPASPALAATPADQSVILEWKNAAGSNSYLESYSAVDPFILDEDNEYLFEGYDVIQYDHGEDFVGRTIATYDVSNGVTRVVDGLAGQPQEVTATGTDSGVATSHTVTGLTNYTTYRFGVQAYAYNAPSYPKVYRGPIARVEVIPTRPTQDVSDAALALAQDHGTPDFVAEAVAVGDGEVFAHVTNPITLVDANYAVEFFAQDFAVQDGSVAQDDNALDPLRPQMLARMGSSATAGVTYNILRNGEVLFDGSALDYPAPLRRGVFSGDGLTFDVLGPPPGFKDFHVTANAAGPLDPPDYAGWGWAGFPDPRGLVVGLRNYQQISGAVWGYHAGGAAQPFGPIEEGSSFLARALRGGTLLPYLGSYDYEQRFTQECADQMDGTLDVEHDCLAIRWYGDDALIEVPFTLWRAGIDTPEDRSDDLQMVPFLCDSETCGGGTEHGVYDIGGDHPASGADNDPYTDWIYWNLPADTSPGSAGYRAFFRGDDLATVQVLARTVLVAWNEGTAPPYQRPLPESGTVFRIISNKQNQPGDRYLLSTHGYGAVQPEGERARARLKDIGIVPNPYKGASNYEVSQLTSEVRFTNLPDVATIRIFTLNGTLIKTIEKRSPGVATISWNLVTDYNLAIASGVYLVHITAPEVGSTVLKFAVIKGLHIFKLGIGELLWRWTLVSTIPFPSYEPLPACFGEH